MAWSEKVFDAWFCCGSGGYRMVCLWTRRVGSKRLQFARPYAQYLRAVERLDRFAQENYARRVLELAVRWALDQPSVTVALWGARHPKQLAPVAAVTGWKLDGAGLKAIGEIIRESVTDPVGPEFMAPPARSTQESGEITQCSA